MSGRDVDASSAVGSTRLDQPAASRPSKTNCTTGDSDALPAGESTWRGYWWKQKNDVVDRFLDEYGSRAVRPVSVRDDVTLREEATAEKAGGKGLRGRPMHAVLREFLGWYNGYRHAHLVFRDPEGEKVRAQMPNSHQPSYGDKYYARLKAFERAAVRDFDDLHVAMLTLTGSHKNDNGGWRCPADHMRDVVSSWRPDRGRGVYHTLRDDLGHLDRWEYAIVLEKHKSGYAHAHVAIFADGELTKDDLTGAIDSHLRQCDIAGPEAHDYHHDDPQKRPISIRDVQPDIEPTDYTGDGTVGNLASYVGEYIGAYGEPLMERGLDELMFRATAWATGTQTVRFSTGANELIDAERDESRGDPAAPSFGWESGTTAEDIEAAVEDDDASVADLTTGERSWSLEGIGRVDEDGESMYDIDRSGVQYRQIDDAREHDPVPIIRFRRPTPRTSGSDLDAYR